MTKKKDNDMICNGAIPPQMATIMDLYRAYTDSMLSAYYAWTALSGMKYWQDQFQQAMRDQEKDSE